jgi:uncharacterized membrane protein
MKHVTDDSWSGAEVPGLGHVPIDALLVVAVVAITSVLVAVLPPGSIARVLATLPLAFFLPGYAVVMVLFPNRSATVAYPTVEPVALTRRGIDLPERVALSVAASLAVVPVVALVVGAAGLALALPSLLAGVVAVTLSCTVGGVYRRSRLDPEEQFHLPVERWVEAELGAIAGRGRLDTALDAFLVVAVVVAAVGIGVAVASPGTASGSTTVSLLTQTESGVAVAGGYPERIPAAVTVSVENGNSQATAYTVVGALERVREIDDRTRVIERATLGRTAVTVGAGETWTDRRQVPAALGGEDLRLVYYVYTGSAPDRVGAGTATERVHIWVDAPVDASETG